MLILTRRIGESIRIGNDIVVKVLSVKGHEARIGITAPKDFPVYREEIYEKIQCQRASDTGRPNPPLLNASPTTPVA